MLKQGRVVWTCYVGRDRVPGRGSGQRGQQPTPRGSETLAVKQGNDSIRCVFPDSGRRTVSILCTESSDRAGWSSSRRQWRRWEFGHGRGVGRRRRAGHPGVEVRLGPEKGCRVPAGSNPSRKEREDNWGGGAGVGCWRNMPVGWG